MLTAAEDVLVGRPAAPVTENFIILYRHLTNGIFENRINLYDLSSL